MAQVHFPEPAMRACPVHSRPRRAFLLRSIAAGAGLLLPASAGAGELREAQGSVAINGRAAVRGATVRPLDVVTTGAGGSAVVIMSRDAVMPERGNDSWVTAFVFKVRNVPSALYKAMGGFATNGVNMTKLESYQVGGTFTATQFYAEVEGHPDDLSLRRALDELSFFSTEVRHLGVFAAHPYRRQAAALAGQ